MCAARRSSCHKHEPKERQEEKVEIITLVQLQTRFDEAKVDYRDVSRAWKIEVGVNVRAICGSAENYIRMRSDISRPQKASTAPKQAWRIAHYGSSASNANCLRSKSIFAGSRSYNSSIIVSVRVEQVSESANQAMCIAASDWSVGKYIRAHEGVTSLCQFFDCHVCFWSRCYFAEETNDDFPR